MLVVIALLSAFLTVPGASAASCDNAVTYAEWANTQRGTMREVEAQYDATGKVVHSQKHGQTIVKQYHYCGGRNGFVQVLYGLNVNDEYMANYSTLFLTG